MPITFWLYIFRKFTTTTALITLLISSIIMLFDAVELFRILPQNMTTIDVLSMSALKNYSRLEKAFPFLIMLGSMITYNSLNKHSELSVSRSLGISIWQILIPSVASSFLLGVLILLLINPIGTFCYSRYEKIKNSSVNSNGAHIMFSGNGVWLQQTDLNTHDRTIIYIGQVIPSRNQIFKVLVFTTNKNGDFIKRIDSRSGSYNDKIVTLDQPVITMPKLIQHSVNSLDIETEVPISKISENIIKPSSVSFLDLLPLIKSMKESGYSILAHQMQFYKMLSLPFLLMAMSMVGICFSLRMHRFGKSGSIQFLGAVIGFFIYFFSDVFYALGASGSINTIISAVMPVAICGLFSSYYLLDREDG